MHNSALHAVSLRDGITQPDNGSLGLIRQAIVKMTMANTVSSMQGVALYAILLRNNFINIALLVSYPMSHVQIVVSKALSSCLATIMHYAL